MNTLVQIEDWIMQWIGFDRTDDFNRWTVRLWIIYAPFFGGYAAWSRLTGHVPAKPYGGPAEITLVAFLVPLVLLGLFAHWRNRRRERK